MKTNSTGREQPARDVSTSPATPYGRRRELRKPGSRLVELRLLPSGQPFPGTLIDLSPRGVGVCGSRPIPPGREFELTFRTHTGETDTSAVYRSVRCARRDGQFHVGAALVRLLVSRAGGGGPSPSPRPA